MGINFTNAANVIKAPNTAKVITDLYEQVWNKEFFQAGEVSWNRESLMFHVTIERPCRVKNIFFVQDTLKTAF